MLSMQIPVRVCDSLRADQAIRFLPLRHVRNHTENLVAIDGAVDNHMDNMNPAWPELASEGLADDTQAGLGGGERGKRRLSAQRC